MSQKDWAYMTSRALKNSRKRVQKSARQKLEMLAAAFQLETQSPASEVMLRQQTVKNEQGGIVLELWFEKIRADMSSVHPDVAYAFDLLMTYNDTYAQLFHAESRDDAHAQLAKFHAFSEEFYDLVKDLCAKYKAADVSPTALTLGRDNDTPSIPQE